MVFDERLSQEGPEDASGDRTVSQGEDRSDPGYGEASPRPTHEGEELGNRGWLELSGKAWEIPLAPGELMRGSYEGSPRETRVFGHHTVRVYGAERDSAGPPATVSEVVTRLCQGLEAQGDAPELAAIREVHIVDDLGHFLEEDKGSAFRAIRAFPPDGEGRVLLTRRTAAAVDSLRLLFSDHLARERWAQAAEACQVRERTILAQVKVAESPDASGAFEGGYGTYQGRPLIGRDLLITGGVYVSGSGRRPAIVVDPTRDHRLRAVYDELKRWFPYWSVVSRLKRTGHSEQRILAKVYSLAREKLPSWDLARHGGRGVDEAVVEAIRRRGKTVRFNQKIYLGEYLRIAGAGGRGGGECVHQSLLAGHLLERLGEDGIARGRVSFERNRIHGMGTHAWIRFTTQKGKVYILDAAQGYLGPVDGSSHWLYMREEDIRELRARPL